MAVLLAGRRIERTLESVNWILVVCILGGFLLMAALFVPAATWLAAASGLAGFDVARGTCPAHEHELYLAKRPMKPPPA